MNSIRKKRLEALLIREISDYIYRDIRKKDDRIGFTSVTRVEISEDLSIAKIFFSLFSNNEKENNISWNILNKFKKKMQSDIARKIRLRRTPQFIFFIDNSIKEGDRILELIEKTKPKEEQEE